MAYIKLTPEEILQITTGLNLAKSMNITQLSNLEARKFDDQGLKSVYRRNIATIEATLEKIAPARHPQVNVHIS